MLGKYFWYQWLFGTIFYVIYTWVVYHMGINSETINHQKTIMAYKNEIIQLKDKQLRETMETIDIFNRASNTLHLDILNLKPQIREIRTSYLKEIERPIYDQCVISMEYFNYLNTSIDTMNMKGVDAKEETKDDKK